MNDSIPSATDVRDSLAGLTTGQVRAIAEKAGVPFTTLWKIKTGETANPGIETVRRFFGPGGLIFEEKQQLPSAARSSAATESVAVQGGWCARGAPRQCFPPPAGVNLAVNRSA